MPNVKAYAASVGRPRGTVQNEVYAAEVAEAVRDVAHDLSSYFMALREIHSAPEWLWSALAGLLKSQRTCRHQCAPTRSLAHANAVAFHR